MADYGAQGIVEAASPGEARLLLYFTSKETEILMAEVLRFHLTLLRLEKKYRASIVTFLSRAKRIAVSGAIDYAQRRSQAN